MKSSDRLDGVVRSSTTMSTSALAIISDHRQQDGEQGDAERRARVGARPRPRRRRRTGPAPVRRPSGRRACRTAGRRRSTVGMATSTPSARVRPRLAPRASMATSGPGCGGTSPCMADRPARVGMPMRDHGQPGAAGDQEDHRHQQHQADLEEHRQADQRADQRHRPRQRPRRGSADDGVDDLVGAAGVGQQLGEHRAERDQHADAGGGRAEARGKLAITSATSYAGDDADGEAAEDQRRGTGAP